MTRGTKGRGTGQPMVLGYLERIASRVFSDFPKELTALAGREHGVYALYKGDRLYYIGLATNLRNRIRHHLRDRHAGKWDKFSLYLVRKADHIRELESLVVRIADPKGNVQAGRLAGARNLKRELGSKIRAAQERQRRDVLGGRREVAAAPARRKKKRAAVPKKGREPALARYVNKPWFKIRAARKGKDYEARVRSDGTINFNGTIYRSPSLAGKAAIGRSTNGWRLWRYKNKDGEWVRLDELRKK